MALGQYSDKPKKVYLGIAEGKFTVPAEFDDWDDEIAELFGDTI